MNNNYEGLVAELGTEDWSEPIDVVAPTPEIAAEKILKGAAQKKAETQAFLSLLQIAATQPTVYGILAKIATTPQQIANWQYISESLDLWRESGHPNLGEWMLLPESEGGPCAPRLQQEVLGVFPLDSIEDCQNGLNEGVNQYEKNINHI